MLSVIHNSVFILLMRHLTFLFCFIEQQWQFSPRTMYRWRLNKAQGRAWCWELGSVDLLTKNLILFSHSKRNVNLSHATVPKLRLAISLSLLVFLLIPSKIDTLLFEYHNALSYCLGLKRLQMWPSGMRFNVTNLYQFLLALKGNVPIDQLYSTGLVASTGDNAWQPAQFGIKSSL